MAKEPKSPKNAKTPKRQSDSGQAKPKRQPPPSHEAPSADAELSKADSAIPFPVVAVGASAGGLEAFTSLLKALATDTGLAFVLIQHTDPTHQSALSGLLQKATSMPVFEVTDGMAVEQNHVYVIPPNTLMTISEGVLVLTSRPRVLRNLPIDHFFQSLAGQVESRAIGVILSGTASDGT